MSLLDCTCRALLSIRPGTRLCVSELFNGSSYSGLFVCFPLYKMAYTISPKPDITARGAILMRWGLNISGLNTAGSLLLPPDIIIKPIIINAMATAIRI